MGMGTWLEACHVGEMASRQGSQCFTLPLRLPLSQSRGVGGFELKSHEVSLQVKFKSRIFGGRLLRCAESVWKNSLLRIEGTGEA